MLNDDVGNFICSIETMITLLSDDEEVHINISQCWTLVGSLDRVALRILVEFLVIQVQILGLRAVNIVEPVAHSIGLSEFETIISECAHRIQILIDLLD